MGNKKIIFKLINSISIFSIIYLFPLIVSFYQSGPNLIGNKYQREISYIENFNDLLNHFLNNSLSNLNIFNNSIFWFFISALITQKTIHWINTD